MANVHVNGTDLFFQLTGSSGEPLVLVHGSWGDHRNWDAVVGGLARSFRVLAYDRRGHSRSSAPAGQGSFEQDADDLAALVHSLGLAPAHMVGNSGGAAIVLKLAARRPELFRSMVVHEPPLFGLIAGDPATGAPLADVGRRIAAVVELLRAGEAEPAARLFVETVAFGPGAWSTLPPQLRETFVGNAMTFLDEQRDLDGLLVDLDALRSFGAPTLLTVGDQSPPFFPAVVARVAGAMPRAARHIFRGAGHVPHISHPETYVQVVSAFALGASRQGEMPLRAPSAPAA